MASEWKVEAGEPGGRQTLADSAWRPWPWLFTGDKKEKVVTPWAGFNPKPAVGQGPQATSGEMDKYDKSYKRKNRKDRIKDKNGLNCTRCSTRGTEPCILTS